MAWSETFQLASEWHFEVVIIHRVVFETLSFSTVDSQIRDEIACNELKS